MDIRTKLDGSSIMKVSVRNNRRRPRRTIYGGTFQSHKDHFDFGPYEGQVVRPNGQAGGKTFFVKDGQGIPYSIGTVAPDGKTYGWDSVKDVIDRKSATLGQKLFSKSLEPDWMKKSSKPLTIAAAALTTAATLGAAAPTLAKAIKTPAIPVKPVPQTPPKIDTSGMNGIVADPNNILNATKASNLNAANSPFNAVATSPANAAVEPVLSSMSDGTITDAKSAVLSAAANLSKDPVTLQQYIDKGTDLVNKGTGVYTDAQLALQKLAANPALLPLTGKLKESMQLLGLPQQEQTPVQAGTIPSNNIGWIIGGVMLLILIALLIRQNS